MNFIYKELFNDYSEYLALMKAQPEKFIDLVAINDLLTPDQQMDCVALFIKISDNVKALKNQCSIDLLGKYYLNKADLELKNFNINQALHFYHEVPYNCSSRGAACYYLALHTFKNYSDIEIALEMVKPYLEEGVALGNQDCKKLYTNTMLNMLNPDKKYELDESSFANIKSKYESSMTIEQKDTAILANLVVKHRLNDLEYWKDQTIWLYKKELEWDKQKIQVPELIAAMHAVIQDKKTTSLQKLKALTTISENNNKHSFFSSHSKMTLECLKDENTLSQNDQLKSLQELQSKK